MSEILFRPQGEPDINRILDTMEKNMAQPDTDWSVLALGLKGYDNARAWEIREKLFERASELEQKAQKLLPVSAKELLSASKAITDGLIDGLSGMTSLKANTFRQKLENLTTKEEALLHAEAA